MQDSVVFLKAQKYLIMIISVGFPAVEILKSFLWGKHV